MERLLEETSHPGNGGIEWKPLCDFANARSKGGDRTRPPPRGGWRGHGWDVRVWQKTSGRGRDGGSTALGRRGKHDSTPATTESSPLRMDHAEACFDGHPQYSPRRPFLLPERNTPNAFLQPGGPPLSEGGQCLRSLHSPNTAPQSHGCHLHPPNSPKNPIGSSGIIVEPPPESHECKAQGGRQDTPPSERGVARP